MYNSGSQNQLQNSIACPKCGRSLPAQARFCGFDGTALTPGHTLSSFNSVQPGQAEGEKGKYCPTCNKQYPSYAEFCGIDAAKLVAVDAIDATMQTTSTSSAPALAATPIPDEDEDSLSLVPNLIGKTVDGKYVIESVVGEGGMAFVYCAHHRVMERTVVIKVMQGWLLANKNAVERFERECKLTAKLNHPNIVSVYDVGLINGREPYLVMEHIKGESLAELIQREGALPLTVVANIGIQVCRGLQEAHSAGIIHRDLKPENILLQEKSDRPDWVKIVDFGISHLVEGNKRLTKTGKMVGTPEYISPEQLKDQPIDIRADLYSFGIILYEMLTGTIPFDGESAESVLMKHLLEAPPPMHLYRDELTPGSPFEAIVAKTLEKIPDNRYQTATELRLDIEQALNSILLKRTSSKL